MNILEAINNTTDRFGGRIAVTQYQGQGRKAGITYRQLASLSDLLAGDLRKRGLKKGQLAGIYMQRRPEQVISMLAVLKTGAAFYSLNPKLTLYQLEYITGICKSPFLIIGGDVLLRLLSISENSFPETELVCVNQGPLNKLQSQFLAKIRAIKQIAAIDLHEDTIHFPNPGISEDDPALALFTSGSTGKPKGVRISHGNLYARVTGECRDFRLSSDDRLLNLLPFSFDVGLNQLFSALVSGAQLIICNSWLPPDITGCVNEYKITGISGVPAVWNDFMQYDEKTVTDCFARLRYFTISGGSMSAEQLKRLRSLAPKTSIYKTYGQTETFRSSILMPEDFEAKMDSIGKAVEGTKVFILKSGNRLAKSGETGEIIHGGNGTMSGYLGGAAATRKKLRNNPLNSEAIGSAGKVVYTGDIGKMDQDGYLYFLGRRDKMLKIEGNRVYPQEISDALLNLEPVRDAAVFGVKDGENGVKIMAEVILKPGFEIGEEELIWSLRQALPSYMIPSAVVLVKDFPRTATGKIKLAELERKYHVQG